MLRQWLEIATLAIARDGLALALPGRSIEHYSAATGSEAAERSSAISMLSALAERYRIRRVRIVISNQLVRYTALPWHEGIPALGDWNALATHEMRRLFGEMADAWDVRVSLQGFGKPAVACGIDREFLSELEAITRQVGWTVVSIEPALMRAFNVSSQVFSAIDGWMMLAEPQRLTLAERVDGAWQRFSMSSPPPGGEAKEASAMLAMATQLSDRGLQRNFCFLGPIAWQPDCSRFPGLLQIRPQSFLRLEREHPLGMLAGLK